MDSLALARKLVDAGKKLAFARVSQQKSSTKEVREIAQSANISGQAKPFIRREPPLPNAQSLGPLCPVDSQLGQF